MISSGSGPNVLHEGKVAIFNRSYDGDVLVVRVHQLALVS